MKASRPEPSGWQLTTLAEEVLYMYNQMQEHKKRPPLVIASNSDNEHPHVNMLSVMIAQVLFDVFGPYPGFIVRPLFSFMMVRYFYIKTKYTGSLLARLVLYSVVLEMGCTLALIFKTDSGPLPALLTCGAYLLRALAYSVRRIKFKDLRVPSILHLLTVLVAGLIAYYFYCQGTPTIQTAASVTSLFCGYRLMGRYNYFLSINFQNVLIGELLMAFSRDLSSIWGVSELMWGVGFYLLLVSIYLQALRESETIPKRRK